MTRKFSLAGDIIPNDYQEIYDWIGWEATSPAKVQQFLNESNNQEVEIDINSPGGDVWSGSEIYSHLKAYQGKVIVNIIGLAASAATIVAMGGDVVRMSPPAQFMIHCSSTVARGDHQSFEHAKEILQNSDEGIRAAYKLKTGLSDEELSAMMNHETWLTAEKAKEKGFVDEIMFSESGNIQIVNSIGTHFMDKQSAMKIKNLMNESNPAQSNEADILAASAKLQLLKIKEMRTTE